MVDKKLALDGVLSQACKLIQDSGVSSAGLQSLFSSDLFSTMLRCPEPHKVDKKALRGMLRIGDKRSVEALRKLCHRKLNQASQAQEKDKFGYTNDWFDYMSQAAKLLRAIYLKSESKDPKKENWCLLRDLYHAEAATFLLLHSYGKRVKLDQADSLLQEARKKHIPCYICGGRGIHWSDLPCKACNGSKLLAVSQTNCSQCKGTDRGTAWAPSSNGFDGLCGYCEGGKILVDSFNKEVTGDVISILGLSRPSI